MWIMVVMKLNFKVHGLLWNEINSLSHYIVPPLPTLEGDHSFASVFSKLNGKNQSTFSGEYKGSMGRITVIGGSKDYTGAPYYAAMSALKFGADLCTVFTSKSASVPIKSYSPELMVSAFYDDTVDQRYNENCSLLYDSLPKQHSLVIGPGLGRQPEVLDSVKQMIRLARSLNKPIVIDADGLWLLNYDTSFIVGYKKCVLTPNRMEFKRLMDSTISRLKLNENTPSLALMTEQQKQAAIVELQSESECRQVRALSVCLGGVVVLLKGAQDLLSAGGDVFAILGESGSPRRCGGQGDILAGSLGVAVFWAAEKRLSFIPSLARCLAPSSQFERLDTELESVEEQSHCEGMETTVGKTDAAMATPSEAILMGSILASVVVKRASGLAFIQQGRSVTAPNILEHLAEAFIATVG